MLMRTFHKRINDGESSLSYDDFDEVSDQSDGESNLCGHVWFGSDNA